MLTKLFMFLLLSVAARAGPDPDDMLIFQVIPKSWATFFFRPPDVVTLPEGYLSEEIRYGQELISNTALYLGPKGSVGQYLGNRMNCKNCHINAGQQLFGGSFATTHARYPEYRSRDKIIFSLADRINSCIVRPHNGKPMPQESREMRAMLMYMKWLGEDRPLNQRRFGDELMELKWLDRAADPERGRKVFEARCVACHGANGQGLLNQEKTAFIYPPLWGPESYGIGSSMHRIRPAAAFIKANMPFGTTWENPVLTDEEAFDVAAFVNDDRIHPRVKHDVSRDYPNLKEKPIDYPYGPYADEFSEEQHKFGPWGPIRDAQKKLRKNQK